MLSSVEQPYVKIAYSVEACVVISSVASGSATVPGSCIKSVVSLFIFN